MGQREAEGDVDGGLDAEALFVRLYPGLRRFAAVVGSFDVEPDDLVQEALVQALRRHPLTEYVDLGAYLRRTIVNLASNRRRSLGRRRMALLRLRPSAEPEPDYPSDLSDLLRLPAQTRALLYLVDVEGTPFADAAAAVGCSEAAARARASRAHRKLRHDMSEEAT